MSATNRFLEDTYLYTVATGSSASDVAVRWDEVRTRGSRIFPSFDFREGVLALDRRSLEQASTELETVFAECSQPNWDGHGAQPVHFLTYEKTRTFLENLPSSAGVPEVNADPDGELVLEWRRGGNRLLSISIALNGRLTFIYRNGAKRMRDTLWFLDQQVPVELIRFMEILRQ
ncbi:MAG TPA: hypothetical protein PLB89_00710 [Flavobacteriales bacterium]|nr:hypothetical protein [Flavobacteriales bacterium]